MNLKTRILTTVLFTFSFVGFAQSNCKELKGCERKLCELNTKLIAAKQAGNQNQVKGIEEAIVKTKKNCTTKTVNNNLDKKVKEKQKEVLKRTADLNIAIKDQERKDRQKKKQVKCSKIRIG